VKSLNRLIEGSITCQFRCILITKAITIPDTNPIIPAIMLENTMLQTYTSNGIGIIACLRVFSNLGSFGYKN